MLFYVFILGCVAMLAPLAIDLYLPALPTVAAAFATSMDSAELTIATFLVGFTLGQIVLGPLADRVGHRVVLTLGLVQFVVASWAVTTTQSIEALCILRFLQGLGGAASVVVFPLLRARFSERESRKAISYVMACIVTAPVIAPVLGSHILELWSWRDLFLVLAGFGAICLGLSLLVSAQPQRAGGLHGSRTLSIRQAYLRILRKRQTVLPLLCSGFAMGGLFAFISGSPSLFIAHYGLPPLSFSYVLSINALAMVVINIMNGSMVAKFAPTQLARIGSYGMAMGATSFGVLVIVDAPVFASVVVGMLFFSALGLAETNSVILAYAEPDDHGAVAGLMGAIQFGFGAIASLLVSGIESDSPFSLALVIFAFGVGAVCCQALIKRDEQAGRLPRSDLSA